MRSSFIFAILLPIALLAQEAPYKAALDSISRYMHYTKSDRGKPFRLATYYSPLLYSDMAEQTDSTIFISMTQNVKTKIVFSDGSEIYMADLKTMDTTMITPGRAAIRFSDVKGKAKLRKSYSPRIFNGKHGGIETEYFLIGMTEIATDEQRAIAQKLMYFIKQAIVYSKKVKANKKDLRFVK